MYVYVYILRSWNNPKVLCVAYMFKVGSYNDWASNKGTWYQWKCEVHVHRGASGCLGPIYISNICVLLYIFFDDNSVWDENALCIRRFIYCQYVWWYTI